ncbi:hypothetical protein D1164_11605 [Mariniphaga sediminis]|jgi:hypothetical protein|uniref:Uncharacterized protein n=1 Tax=Mariniphaga sediminis TaxID=1628158 RepID=A0A399D044_9BACT|nr:hypothetical protein [Mariniphaga sediminis]RIH65224.1 hypothetical protein D1164_11605 [Mariniphaga sediminis]
MKRKAIPNINAIPNKHNPLFETYTDVFDIAFDKNLNKSSNLKLLAKLYIKERITDNGNTFEKRFKNLINLRAEDVERHFQEYINENYKSIDKTGNIYFLVGKIGTGKTTFIKHFIYSNKDISSCYIDLEPFAVPIEPTFDDIRKDILSKIKEHLNSHYKEYFTDINLIREVFKDRYPAEVSTDYLLSKIDTSIEEYIALVYTHLFQTKKNNKYTLIFDNGDTCSVNIIRTIFGYIKKLIERIPALFIFSVRDYIPNQNVLGTDFQNRYPMISLPPLKISILIKRRFEYSIEEIKVRDYNQKNRNPLNQDIEIAHSNVKTIQSSADKKIKINSLTAQTILLETSKIFKYREEQESIYDHLIRISDGNIREVIELIYSFFHSPNLDLIPFIQNVYNDKPILDARYLDIKDFIACTICKHKDCYDTESSPIINLFNLDNSNFDGDPINTLGLVYTLIIIQNFSRIDKTKLIQLLTKLNFSAERVDLIFEKLLGWNMIGSPNQEFPKQKYITEVVLTDKGDYYISTLIHQFSYLLHMSENTPMHSYYVVNYNERKKKFNNRFKSVNFFLDFLSEEIELFNRKLSERPDLIQNTEYSKGVNFVEIIKPSIEKEIISIKRELKGNSGKI